MTDLQDNIPQQNSNQPKPRTPKLAIAGIALFIVFLIILLTVLLPWLNKTLHLAKRLICGVNLDGIGCALKVYANDYNNTLPPADQWNDLLIMECDISPKSFVCPGSDAIEGESSYAININAVGKNLGQLPTDMVLLFETDAGWDNLTRSELIKNRTFYSYLEKDTAESSIKWTGQNANSMVYPHRWNLAGGPEMLTTRCHQGEGCNVIFADGHPSYIPSNQLHTLRWTSQEPNQLHP
jgi:prepilin-type processing-associated H-X9-DG protein